MQLKHFVFGKFTAKNSSGRPPDYRVIIYDPDRPSSITLDWIREQVNSVLPDRHTSEARVLLQGGDAWIYVRVFGSLPGEQGSSNGIVRYHAVQLTMEELDTLRWQPWSLDSFLIEGIGEESLLGNNPSFHGINQNSSEVRLPIEVDLAAVGGSVRPSTDYSKVIENTVAAIKNGKKVHLVDCGNVAVSAGVIGAVLRRFRSVNIIPPSSAVELTFADAERPLSSSLLKIVAAEVAKRGVTPSDWIRVSVGQLLVESGGTGAEPTHGASSAAGLPDSPVPVIKSSVQQEPPDVILSRLSETEQRLESLQKLLNSNDKTSERLNNELTKALDRSATLEGELKAARSRLSDLAAKPTVYRTPKWIVGASIPVVLIALMSSVLWVRTSTELRSATDQLQFLRVQIDQDAQRRHKKSAAEIIATDEAALERATAAREVAARLASEKDVNAEKATNDAEGAQATADKSAAAAIAAEKVATAKAAVAKAKSAKAASEHNAASNTAAEKAAADEVKADEAAAAKAATSKAAAEKAAAAKAAARAAATEKATADQTVADRVADEKAAAAQLAADKAAAAHAATDGPTRGNAASAAQAISDAAKKSTKKQ